MDYLRRCTVPECDKLMMFKEVEERWDDQFVHQVLRCPSPLAGRRMRYAYPAYKGCGHP